MTSRAAAPALGFALCCILGGQAPAATKRARTRPVFPGAVGFGVDSPAGRGGRIVRVRSLAADGTGSLRAALEAKGPRVIIFEVGGVIDLGKKALRIREPFVTIAGQTAPTPGITVIRGGIYVTTHDVLIRHIRVRPGDSGERKRSGWEPDGISTSGGEAYNIIVDHCSVTWATDENLSASGPRLEGPKATSHDITFSNCIIAECLSNSTHAKGRHSKGSLIHDCCTNIAIIGNLYAHNDRRNPYFKAHTTGVVVGNLIYNPGNSGVQVNWVTGEWRDATLRPVNCRIGVVGNVMLHGRDTRKGLALVSGRGDVYMKDNIATDREGRPVKPTSGKVKILEDTPVWPEGLEPVPASEVVERVLKHAGA
ncbi:MAG: pectate lyase family protein, partial [Planctomycetota bacterium]